MAKKLQPIPTRTKTHQTDRGEAARAECVCRQVHTERGPGAEHGVMVWAEMHVRRHHPGHRVRVTVLRTWDWTTS